MAVDLEEGERVTLHNLMAANAVVREIYSEMPAQQLAVLLEVVNHPGITMRDIETKLGMSNASISRNISALSEWEKFKKPGLNLVVRTPNPHDRRYQIVDLTPKGRAFARNLIRAARGRAK